MRVIITGRDGQVGGELVRLLDRRVELIPTGRRELDLEQPDRIVRFLREIRPDLIINAAAYTAVDRAESEPDAALAVNARAPGILGEEAARLGAAVVHYSTDYVFDGTKPSPYTEEDRPAPLGAYGRTKRLGEEALAESGAAHLTFRVAWVYGDRPGNFLTRMLALFGERRSVSVVDDEVGAPTWSRHVADATIEVLEAVAGGLQQALPGDLREGLHGRGGLYHLAPEGETSWHGFAREIRRVADETELAPLAVEELRPIPAREWHSPVARPPNSRLSAARLAGVFDVRLPDWRAGVATCVRDIAARHGAVVV